MVEVFPRRNLGPSEYWGRVVESRLEEAEKAVGRAQNSLAGVNRANDSAITDLARQIDQLEEAILAVPTVGSNASSASGFALEPGWNTLLSFNVPVSNSKPNLNVIATGRVTIRDDGPTGGGGGGYFQWPFPLDYVTSEYGWRPGPDFHSGIDFAGGPAAAGNPIYAPADGVVISKGFDGSRGNYINLSHVPGLVTRYFHMISSSPLNPGDPVTRGSTILGYVGNTGSSFGAHLHWETYIEGGPLNEEGYPAMNPRDFMAIYGGDGGGPSTGEYANIVARIVIAGNPSLEFEPYKLFYSDPDRIYDYLYPQHGVTLTGSSVPVNLDVWSSAAIPADGFNTASLSAYGIFS